jgi:hypothetical protein
MKKVLPLGVMLLFACGISAQTVLIDQDFESGSLPMDWSLSQNENSVGWEFGDSGDLSSLYVAIPEHTSFAASNDDEHDDQTATMNIATEDRLITPSMDLSSVTTAILTFSTFNPEAYGSNGTVEVSTDGGDNWSMVFDIPENADQWVEYNVNLEDYVGESEVWVAFRHNDNSAWASAVAVDDVQVFVPEADDVRISGLDITPFAEIGSDAEITATIQNYGASNLTSFDLTWSPDGGSTEYSQSVSGIDLAPLESYTITHNDLFGVSGYDGVEITVTANNPNGMEDPSPQNNTMTTTIAGLDFIPNKRVFVEEATGTWCGWCPRGFVFMELLHDEYEESTVLVAVHNNDPMEDSEYDSGIGTQIGGYPSGLVDRANGEFDPLEFEDAVLDRMDVIPPASVDVTHSYDGEAGEVTVTVTATFATNFSGADYRLNGVLIENNVTGTGGNWAQVNYYSGGGVGDMEGWEDLPDPVPAEDMVYHEVARGLLAGWNGEPNSVPSDISAGESFSFTTTKTIESSWDPANMLIAGMLIDNSTGEIINSEYSEGSVLSIEDATSKVGFNVYPNPATTVATIELEMEDAADVSIDIMDASGRTISSKNYGQVSGGKQIVRFSTDGMPSGMYVVRATVDGKPVVRKLVVNK